MTRSEQMARIRSGNTRPEVTLRKALWREGLRYRIGARTPVGRPDLLFARWRVAVFVDGCFWHGCPKHYAAPRTQREFWAKKLDRNVERDRLQTVELERIGWTVVRVWECSILKDLLSVVRAIQVARHAQGPLAESSWRVKRVEFLENGLERRVLETLRSETRCRLVEGPRVTGATNASRRARAR
jgi:DNA mismatch endonuclease, patch repair protein